MAYWKELDGTEKEGQFGTMSDGKSAPNSKTILSSQYRALLDAQNATERGQ